MQSAEGDGQNPSACQAHWVHRVGRVRRLNIAHKLEPVLPHDDDVIHGFSKDTPSAFSIHD